ncbi:MAG TPA: zf-HC2 domain-containing protein [Candidatus Dormibacteraeota bacterium]|nr:zf-HC2 domain-containing protein [Candidatus Dormibacteraeota bacterium]
MPEKHLDDLFAPAFDGVLDRGARRRFDDHLAGCDRCAAAFADHCAAAEAVRGLPAARMPVAVRLPTHAPKAAGGGVVELLGGRRAFPIALGGLAAAAAAAVVVAVALHGGGGTTTSTSGAGVAQAPDQGQQPLASPSSISDLQPRAGAAPAAQQAVPPLGLASSQNVVRVEGSGRPGQVLFVATAERCYAPGSQITVFAGLVDLAAADTVLPVTPAVLSPAGATPAACDPSRRAAADGPPAGVVPPASITGYLAAPSSVLLVPSAPPQPAAGGLAAPTPTAIARAVAGGSGTFTVTVPATATKGEVLDLVVTVAAGVPSGIDTAPITAILQITVG